MASGHVQTITYKGRTQTIKQWAIETGIPAPTITERKRKHPGDYEYIFSAKHHRNLDKNTVLEQPEGGKITVADLAKKLGLTYPAVLVRARKYGINSPKVFAEKERGISSNFKNIGRGFRHAKTGKKAVAGTGKRVDKRLENNRPATVRVVADNALGSRWRRFISKGGLARCFFTGERIYHPTECDECPRVCRFAGQEEIAA